MDKMLELLGEEEKKVFYDFYLKNFSTFSGDYDSLLNRDPQGNLGVYITSEINSSLKLVLRGVMEFLNVERGQLYIQKTTGKRVSVRSHGDNVPKRFAQIVDLSINSGDVLIYKPQEKILDYKNHYYGDTEEHIISVPIGLDKEFFGAFVFVNPKTKDSFDDEDEQILTTLALTFASLLQYAAYRRSDGQLVSNFVSALMLILEKTFLFQKYKRSNATLEEVIHVSKMINSSSDLQSLLLSILSSAKKVLSAESSSLLLIDEENHELFFNSVAGEKEKELKEIRVPIGKGIAGIVAQSGEPLIINDALHDDRVYKSVDEHTNFVTRNLMCVPLVVRNKVIGVIEVLNSLGRTQFNHSDLNLFMSFSDHAALAINNRDLIDNLKAININLERKVAELTTLFQIGSVITEAKEEQEIFDRAVRILVEKLNLKSCSVFFYHEKKQNFFIKAQYGLPRVLAEKRNHDLSHSIIERVYNTREFLRLTQDDQFDQETINSLKDLGFNAPFYMLFPLVVNQTTYGIFVFAGKEDLGFFSEEDENMARAVVSQLQRGYESLLLQQELILNETLKKEVETSQKIQQAILPHSLPEVSGVDLAAMSQPAKQVGGDFYDITVLSDGQFALTVADVSGKSLPAALFMASTSSIIRTLAQNIQSPKQLLEKANDLIYQSSEAGMFVTLFYIFIDLEQGEIRYSSAGHNQQILVKANGEVRYLHAKGSPLGILPLDLHGSFAAGAQPFEPGDTLILYTDGVIEAINSAQEEFEEKRFLSTVHKLRRRSAQEIIDGVFHAVNDFAGDEPQFDDFTMVVAKYDNNK